MTIGLWCDHCYYGGMVSNGKQVVRDGEQFWEHECSRKCGNTILVSVEYPRREGETMTTSKVRDAKIAAAMKRLDAANSKIQKHKEIMEAAAKAANTAGAEVAWLKTMPVDDAPASGDGWARVRDKGTKHEYTINRSQVDPAVHEVVE